MSLDERGLNILKLLVNNPTISGSQLEKEAGLSRKQLSYSLAKIKMCIRDSSTYVCREPFCVVHPKQ